ncbi:sushi, von Willebrand factor type A, EGF and pentraxin domain-containing protein 1-like [Acropora millepora]|uniref:sushi, von Willebrand factor type A, EGF and pentraxin domain-containing protein 1-like n=1 Tax=Acropora millepora TaxID=45264 RepID=UPI001CF4B1E7|nr:sushi, von Willebrand factor type A, EGF and pentraxin domain-containing protein 1-like [Acropora millepora]
MSLALYVFSFISLMGTSNTAVEKCKVYQVPIRGKALRGHTYKTAMAGELFRCYVRCERDPVCKSCNFKHSQQICEMNNETKETKPNDFIAEQQSYYIKRTGGDVDECAAFPNICDANADCQNTDGSFICNCKAGYTGDGRSCFRANVNECKKRQTNLCNTYAFCNNTKGSYRCHCKQGFVGDGFNCIDVNECEKGLSNPCGKNAFCNNTKGSYSCHCNQGFVNDGFSCVSIVPHPSAWFPLNGTYNISEIENRTSSGSTKGKVYLSLGPDGTQNGSYFFQGSNDSVILFSGINLNILDSITILCWFYVFDNNVETVFLQYQDTKLSVNGTTLTMKNSKLKELCLTGTLADKGWTLVGLSYNETSAEAQLWIDGHVANSRILTTKLDSKGYPSLKLGGNNFKGKITQLMLFNLTLTQEQVQEINGRMKLPGGTESSMFKKKIFLKCYFRISDLLHTNLRHKIFENLKEKKPI